MIFLRILIRPFLLSSTLLLRPFQQWNVLVFKTGHFIKPWRQQRDHGKQMGGRPWDTCTLGHWGVPVKFPSLCLSTVPSKTRRAETGSWLLGALDSKNYWFRDEINQGCDRRLPGTTLQTAKRGQCSVMVKNTSLDSTHLDLKLGRREPRTSEKWRKSQ